MRALTAHSGQPAWPTLIGVQLVGFAALLGLGWRMRISPVAAPPPLEVRIQQLDLPAATAGVEAALAQVQDEHALLPAAQRHLASLLALDADAANLRVRSLSIESGDPVGVLLPVNARLQVQGDAFDLPILLDAVYLQRALVRVDELVLDVSPGGQSSAVIQLQFYRPAPPSTDWIRPRLLRAAPGADRAAPLLQRAAQLQAWRAFDDALPELQQRAVAGRQALAHALPAHLVTLRRGGGRLLWTPGAGISLGRTGESGAGGSAR